MTFKKCDLYDKVIQERFLLVYFGKVTYEMIDFKGERGKRGKERDCPRYNLQRGGQVNGLCLRKMYYVFPAVSSHFYLLNEKHFSVNS